MNQENRQSGIDSASKNNSQRVSVIKWSGKVSSMISKEKSSFKQAYTFPVAEEESFVSSCRIVSSSNSAGKYQCLFCRKSFKWHSHWKSHERTHTGERPFQCEVCGKSFARSDGLQCHKLTHIAKDPSYFSRTKENVKAVLCTYPPAEREKSIVATTQKDVSREHEKAKLFNCHHCDRIFFSSAGMVKHMQVHQGRNNFICEKCNMIFTKRSAMEVHSRVHTGVKPFQCNICPKAFSIYGNLKRHMLIHTGERPYKCCECSNSFNNPSHLARHFKKKHDGQQKARHFKKKYEEGQN